MSTLQDIQAKEQDILTQLRGIMLITRTIKELHAEGKNIAAELDELATMEKDLERMLQDDIFVRNAVYIARPSDASSQEK